MNLFRWLVSGVGLVLIVAYPSPASGGEWANRSAADLAREIDRWIESGWRDNEVKPTRPADDAEFCRRVYLDLAGRIPTVAEVRTFLDDPSPDKRPKLVNDLLQSPANVNHFVHVFRDLMLPEAKENIQLQFLAVSFEAWLRQKLVENASYAEMVRELLTVRFRDRPVAGLPGFATGQRSRPSPVAFYQAKGAKPENLAASTARIFLGIRIECAQCHNHPTADWKKENFWSFAAFFAGLQRRSNVPFGPVREVLDQHELAIPDSDQVVTAMFLDGTEPVWRRRQSPRVALADWITSPDNPYFARATANRIWAHFFGVGLVDPVDDLDPANPPSHPELLDILANALTDHDFDLHFLMRAITSSRAYQLSSVQTDASQSDPRLFARMSVKGLTPEQIFDSLRVATGLREPRPAANRRFVFQISNSLRQEVMNRFGNRGDKPTEMQTSILQALSLMNGRLTSAATDLASSGTLAAVADAPFLDTGQRIETLFLATLSRRPTAEEANRLIAYVDSGGATNDPNQALADVFWALLNSAEFILNH